MVISDQGSKTILIFLMEALKSYSKREYLAKPPFPILTCLSFCKGPRSSWSPQHLKAQGTLWFFIKASCSSPYYDSLDFLLRAAQLLRALLRILCKNNSVILSFASPLIDCMGNCELSRVHTNSQSLFSYWSAPQVMNHLWGTASE